MIMVMYKVIAISFALAVDAFSVATSVGGILKKVSGRQRFRLSFHFGLFQFLMPLMGWFGGKGFASFIGGAGHIVAFIFLLLIGSKMIYSVFEKENINP